MDQKQLKALVKRRHPEYKSMIAHWDFMESCYWGGRPWFEGNIFQYLKEGDGEFKDRVQRAYRFNHSREAVDLINKYLFRADIHRNKDDAPEPVRKFWEEATLQGLSIDEYMRIASVKSSVGGRPWLIVDNMNRSIGENASQADEAQARIYSYVVRPQDVLDLSYDEYGKLNWILIREIKRDDTDPFDSSGALSEQYRLWTRDDWVLIGWATKNRLKVEDSGVHGLGEVPAVKLDNTIDSHLWHSPALIADIAYLDRATANYASNLDAIIQDQTFSQLAMPAQNVLPGDDAYDKILEMGTKRIFLYDGEGGKGPEYLSPDPRQAQLIISAIQQIINEIYHCVGLAGERTKQDNSKGIDNSSGVAKAFDFERVTALLRSKADSLETAENRIVRLVCLWAGDTPPEEDMVAYSDNFDVRGLQDEIDIAMQLAVMAVPEQLRSEQLKVLVEKLFPNLGVDLKKKMESDIEVWAKELKEQSDLAKTLQSAGGSMLEEARRNRDKSGQKQSGTKSRGTGSE